LGLESVTTIILDPWYNKGEGVFEKTICVGLYMELLFSITSFYANRISKLQQNNDLGLSRIRGERRRKK
jgi:hypothetical protein